MNHDERKLAGFKCILLLTIWLILCWILQAMEVAIDHIAALQRSKEARKEVWFQIKLLLLLKSPSSPSLSVAVIVVAVPVEGCRVQEDTPPITLTNRQET
jgi:hypothetical protein